MLQHEPARISEKRTLLAKLSSGGTVEMQVTVDWSRINDEDRRFVHSLLDMFGHRTGSAVLYEEDET